MMHTAERIGRELASPSRGRPAFGKRQPDPGRTKEKARPFARHVNQSTRSGGHTHLTRRLVMAGAIAMTAAVASPFLYSAMNTMQVATADPDALSVDDVANFVTAAGSDSRPETVR